MQSIKIYHTESTSKWSSFSDVGVTVALDEYIAVEQAYVDFVLTLLPYLPIQEFQIVGLEDYASVSSYQEADVVACQDLDKVVRDVLREKYWCKLIAPYAQIHFGYDYCMYVISFLDEIDLKHLPYDEALVHVMDYTSPYLGD